MCIYKSITNKMTSSYSFSYFMEHFEGELLGIKKELFKFILNKCNKNKTKTCRHKFDFYSNSLKIYMDEYENLYFKEYCDILEFTQLTNGEEECVDCGYHNKNYMYDYDDYRVCKDCLFTLQREERVRKLLLEKQTISVFKISTWFLDCKYNPKYKYCQNRINKMYDDEFK